jgi:hypothetical protein
LFQCHACTDGYHFLQFSDICSRNGATGLSLTPNGWEAGANTSSTLSAEFRFGVDGTFTGIEVTTGVAKDPIMLHGTSEPIHGYEVSQPFGHTDRGLWFDGRYHILQMSGLILYHTTSIEFWARPDIEGTIYSSASAEGSFYFGISDSELILGVSLAAVKSYPEAVESNTWQ